MRSYEYDFEDGVDEKGNVLDTVMVLKKSQLVELSITPDPADSAALIKAKVDEHLNKKVQDIKDKKIQEIKEAEMQKAQAEIDKAARAEEKREVAREVSRRVYNEIINNL